MTDYFDDFILPKVKSRTEDVENNRVEILYEDGNGYSGPPHLVLGLAAFRVRLLGRLRRDRHEEARTDRQQAASTARHRILETH